ncbi:hypothetical protein L7F22_021230 [Adiantum nelumboides]|nr:hypothetical protein [Adiantum nelumboides]
MIRGAVRALMVPTNLASVWACLQQQLLEIEGSSGCSVIGEGKLFQSLFNGLLKEGAFCGSLRAGGSVWTPAVFEKTQHEGIEAFYSQNSYISYDMLRKLAISQPKQFLQGKYPDGIALETLFMHSSFISMVDAAVEEAIDGGGWLDCVALVPSSFPLADVARLVSFCPYIQKAEKEAKSITLAETCVVSTSFLKVLTEKLELEVKDLVSLFAAKLPGTRSVSADLKDLSLKGSNTQGKAGKRKQGSVASGKPTITEAAEDEYTAGKGSKGKKRGGKPRAGNQSSIALSNKSGKGDSERPSSREEDGLSQDFFATRILELFPELEGAGIDDDGVSTLSKAIAAHLRPSLLSIWETAKQASFSAASEQRRHRADTLQKKTDEVYASLQLFAKALDLFADDHVTLTALHRHLLRTTASQLVDVILQTQELERRLENGDACDESSICRTEPSNGSERLFLAKGLDGALTTKCVKMVEALEGKVFEGFELALQEVADECGLQLKKLDKKAERALLSTYRKELASQIETESDPITLLPKVVGLLFTQIYNKALQAPGRTIGSAINHLKKMIAEDAFSALVEYQSATVAFLSMLSTSTPGGSDCTSDRMEEQRQRLISMMPRLKDIALMPQPGL